MGRLLNASPAELAEDAKALVEQYKKSAEEAKVDVADYVIGSIDAIFAGVEPPSSAEIMKSVESTMKETIVTIVLPATPVTNTLPVTSATSTFPATSVHSSLPATPFYYYPTSYFSYQYPSYYISY